MTETEKNLWHDAYQLIKRTYDVQHTLTNLTLPLVCVCPNLEPGFQTSYVVGMFFLCLTSW